MLNKNSIISEYRNTLLFLGIFFILLGVGLVSWRLWMASRPQQWQIQVHGITHISAQDIENLVLYLLRNPQGVSKQEIEQTLLLNPRIENVAIEVKNKKMDIFISERLPALLLHRPPAIMELASNLQILQEDLLATSYNLNSSLPLFFLNSSSESSEKNKKEFTKYQRDIIRLWETTKLSYSFIWERISEIEALWKKNKAHFYLYLSVNQVKIHLQDIPSVEILQRLWATFYYLEAVAPSTLAQEVELYQDHAIVRQKQVTSNGL